jgi:mono/diheme cytochrome c family protein
MKLSKWTLLLVAVMVTAALLPLAAKSQGNAAPAGNVNNGKELYLKYGCYACHGYTAQTGNGAHLVSTKLNLQGFTNYIRNPRTNGMPTYTSKVVPDQQAADLFAYIKTFKEPPAAKDIPLLNQILNEK